MHCSRFGGCIQAINDKYIKEQLTLLFVDLLLIEAFLAVTFSVQFFEMDILFVMMK